VLEKLRAAACLRLQARLAVRHRRRLHRTGLGAHLAAGGPERPATCRCRSAWSRWPIASARPASMRTDLPPWWTTSSPGWSVLSRCTASPRRSARAGVRLLGTSGHRHTLAGVVLELKQYSRPAVDGVVLSRAAATGALADLRADGAGRADGASLRRAGAGGFRATGCAISPPSKRCGRRRR